MSLYFDASAIVPLLIEEATSPAVRKIVDIDDRRRLVSDFAGGEASSAIARLYRIGTLDLPTANWALSDLDRWRLTDCETPRLEPDDIRAAALLVRRFDLKLRLPDAIHAAACQRLGATLVTFDRRLADAAAALGIAALVP